MRLTLGYTLSNQTYCLSPQAYCLSQRLILLILDYILNFEDFDKKKWIVQFLQTKMDFLHIKGIGIFLAFLEYKFSFEFSGSRTFKKIIICHIKRNFCFCTFFV